MADTVHPMNSTPLAKYVRENSITREDFAQKAGISMSLVNKLCAPGCNHQCLYTTAKRISAASDGALKTSDFDGEKHG